jgi:hypothetical protein
VFVLGMRAYTFLLYRYRHDKTRTAELADWLHLTSGLLVGWVVLGHGSKIICFSVAAFLLCFIVVEWGQMGIELAFSL